MNIKIGYEYYNLLFSIYFPEKNSPSKRTKPIITGSIARSANLPVFRLLRGRF